MSNERNALRLRDRSHFHPDRQNEVIVEVVRDGRTIATIYGSREGIHVVTDLAPRMRPFLMKVEGATPSWVLPLLAEDEECPWCEGRKVIQLTSQTAVCPVCQGPPDSN